MVYSSQYFIVFFVFVAVVFFEFKRVEAQNTFLFLASCFFISFSGLTNLLIVLAAVSLSYAAIVASARRPGWKITTACILLLVANLTFFKVLPAVDLDREVATALQLGWTVPLGISFYTFQIIGSLLELHGEPAGTVRARRYANFVMFFPHLIAGPICRTKVLLPQFDYVKTFNSRSLRIGIYFFAIGYLKKTLMADPIARMIDPIWNSPSSYGTVDIAAAIIGFYIQVYCDFSGYTDMGRGVARMLGFRLPINFRAPYLSASPLDFWQRWHISLTIWYRRYLFQPLAFLVGRRVRRPAARKAAMLLLVLTVMVTVGLWHGFAWRYVAFGLIQGVAIIAWQATGHGGTRRGWPETLVGAVLFQLVLLVSLAIFRAPTPEGVAVMAAGLISPSSQPAATVNLGYVAFCLLGTFCIQTIELLATRRTVARVLRVARTAWPAMIATSGALLYLVYRNAEFAEHAQAVSNRFIYFDF